MAFVTKQNGNPFGSHRVIAPPGVLPQPAEKIDNNFQRIWDNDLLLDVQYLNIDSASFTQIRAEQGDDDGKICARIMEIADNFTYFVVYAKALPELDYSKVQATEAKVEKLDSYRTDRAP